MTKDAPRQVVVKVCYAKKVKSKKKKKVTKKQTASVMAEYSEGFTYTDPASGESDTVSIKLSNIDWRFASTWLPAKGDKMTAKIVTQNWNAQGVEKVFSCGKFCVDDLSFSGPELTCTIGGVSVPDGNAFRCTERSKIWHEVTLKEVAREMARKYHLKLSYTASKIKLGTIEQSNETDSSFLNKVCQDFDMALKIYYGKIIIYDKRIFEKRRPVATIHESDMQSWSCNSTITGTYTGARIKYAGDGDTERECVVGSGKRILNISEKADNLQDAKIKACAKVNAENEKSVTMTVSIMADNRIAAGSTVNITGMYQFNGKYFVDQVSHSIEAGGGYTMDLELHKCQKRIYKVKRSKKK